MGEAPVQGRNSVLMTAVDCPRGLQAIDAGNGSAPRQEPGNDGVQQAPVPENVDERISQTTTEHRTESRDLENGTDRATPTAVPFSLTGRLYISHFLSTWNSRWFEMGSALFLAHIFPGTLLPMSVYALVRNASAVVLSPAIGHFIDTKDRLQVVRLSIVVQRLSVASSCVVFWAMASQRSKFGSFKEGLLALATLLACLEKLSFVANFVSVERDWVVVITEDNPEDRRVLNARMRRIDLFCKLLGPLMVSVIDGVSPKIAIFVTLGVNLASAVVEIIAISKLYHLVPTLRRGEQTDALNIAQERNARGAATSLKSAFKFARSQITRGVNKFSFYFHHASFLPSFSLALLYLTVLSFSGQMVTFLVFNGYKSSWIGAVRATSTVFELSATWLAPRAMQRVGPVRSGIWFLSWQMICLASAVASFWAVRGALLSTSCFVGAVILSRPGLWGFDLSAQTIIQNEVEPDSRGNFSSVEAAFQNFFELCAYASTIIFPHPAQFKWPVVMSIAAVYVAGGLYALFTRKRRGHLIHPLGFYLRKGAGDQERQG